MSDLDQELERAIAESEADAAAGSVPPAGERPVEAVQAAPLAPKPAPRRNLGLLLGLLVIGGGVLTLVMTSANQAAIYSVPTDELVAKKAEYAARNVRVEGTLVKGSLRQRAEPCEYRFSIEKNGAKLPVRFPQCVVPDTFRDAPGMDVQVTAEGRLSPEGHFEATNIMAKCPSKYEMQERAAKGEKAPHATYGGPLDAPAAPGPAAQGPAAQGPAAQVPAAQVPAAPAPAAQP
jgi:cytochrome c-type biogenesis protein CcmE